MSSSEELTECVVCYIVATDTYSCTNENCLRLLCGECVARIKGNACPMCREENTIKPNKNVSNMIGRQKIICPKKCGKKIRRRSIDIHLTYCKTEE